MADVQTLNFSWLLKLRWAAIVAQLLVFFSGDRLVHVSLPLVPLLLIIAVELITNLGCTFWAARVDSVPEAALAALMALDSLLLTAMLYLTASDSSPFAVLYLVNIALAGILLRPRWTWSLTAVSAVCFGILFASRLETRDGAMAAADPMVWQLREMWLAFAVASGLIVYFVQRTTRMLRERERAAEAAHRSAERREKLASLATLAAGAAHELATPLSTIALVAKELERQLRRGATLCAAIDDARLIREEVDRCRAILSRMATDAGGNPGEHMEMVQIDSAVDQALAGIRDRDRVRVQLQGAARHDTMAIPPRAFSQGLHAVLKNALQASPIGQEVCLCIRREGANWRIEVADRGSGMSPQILARAGEPFFTTKEPGQGMGLGLFLTRALLEQLGGRLEISSVPERGTTVALVIPQRQGPVEQRSRLALVQA